MGVDKWGHPRCCNLATPHPDPPPQGGREKNRRAKFDSPAPSPGSLLHNPTEPPCSSTTRSAPSPSCSIRRALPSSASGIVLGLIIGMLPGIGGLGGLALLIPFTHAMDTHTALAFLIGMWAVTATSDTIPAILFGVPGAIGSAATVLDGHPMAKRGEAGRAFGASFMSSIVGGLVRRHHSGGRDPDPAAVHAGDRHAGAARRVRARPHAGGVGEPGQRAQGADRRGVRRAARRGRRRGPVRPAALDLRRPVRPIPDRTACRSNASRSACSRFRS